MAATRKPPALQMPAAQRRRILVGLVRKWEKILAGQGECETCKMPMGLMARGSTGQPVAHPGVAELRMALKALEEIDRENPPEKPPADDLEKFIHGG